MDTNTDVVAIRDKFIALQNELNTEIFERNQEIHGAVLALLARQHHFQLGTPGVAKSLLVERIVQRIDGLGTDGYFRWLLTRYTTPEELFGGPDFNLLRDAGIYKRITERKLPRAHIGFLDEALALTTPVPTPNGWTTIGELSVGDSVIGADGWPTTVEGLTPIATDHDCYRVTFIDGNSIVADAGHNWSVTRGNSDTLRVMTTKEIVDYKAKYEVDVYVAPPQPMQLPEADLPVNPYVLGLWLGNGNRWNGEVYIRTEWADRTLKLIQEIYPTAYVRGWSDTGSITIISLAHSGFRSALGSMGLLGTASEGNKHMPPLYLRGSHSQRLAILRGLTDTDGYVNPKSGTVTFSNTNESVIDGYVELVHSFGWRAGKMLTTDDRVGAKGPHKACWKVHFRADPHTNPFLARDVDIPAITHRNRRRIDSIELVPSVPVRCINVAAADHLFVAGDGMVTTHNCFKGNSSILNANLTALNERKFFNHDDNEDIPLISAFTASNEMPQGDELEALWDRLLLRYILKPMRESSSFVKMLATKMVAHPEKVLSLDDLHTAHRMVDDVVIPQSVFDAMKSLRSSLNDENIDPSPRRWVESLDVIRAEAFMNGHDVAEIVDLRPLMHIMWSEPGQIRNVQRAVLELADPIDRQATGIIEVLDELDAEMRTAIKDAVGKELARTSVEVHRRLRRIDEELKNLKTEQATLDRESEVLTEALDKFKVLVKLLVNDGFKLSEMDI